MNRVVFLGILLFATTINVSMAQNDTVSLNLREARQFALENNRDLLNAKEDIAVSEAEYKATRAEGLPQVDGTVDYTTNFNYEVEFDPSAGEKTSTPDIDPTLLDEGDREVLNAIQQMMAPSEPATILMEDQMNARVRVSQLIFSGQYWVGLETAKIAKELAKKQVDQTELEVKKQITNIYYLILISEKSLEILNENIANLKNVLEHTRNMARTGLVEETDVDQIRMSLSKLKNNRASTKRNIRVNYKMLKIQMGLDRNKNIVIRDSLSSVMDKTEDDLLVKNLELNNNPSFQLLESQEQMKEKQVDLKKWAYAPNLTGYYSYTEKIMTTGFDLSPNNAAGFTLSVPIFSSGSRKAKVNKAKIELDKTRRNKEKLEDQLKLQEDQLKYELKSALENYQTQKKNVKVAERVYNNTHNKYSQGLVSSMDLTQANNNYLEAKSNYVSSVLKLLQAKLNLEELYGTL